MEIKIFAQIEVPIDERFSRTDNITITLGDEAITAIANAIAAQQNAHLTCATCRSTNSFEYDEELGGDVCVRCGTRR